ncbi:MAG: fibronectin type III domain-containing protein [Lachnospiraceae bacterium]|nr:fibronectin type III domain-containing protein [Lachnospiraceae bacterium]
MKRQGLEIRFRWLNILFSTVFFLLVGMGALQAKAETVEYVTDNEKVTLIYDTDSEELSFRLNAKTPAAGETAESYSGVVKQYKKAEEEDYTNAKGDVTVTWYWTEQGETKEKTTPFENGKEYDFYARVSNYGNIKLKKDSTTDYNIKTLKIEIQDDRWTIANNYIAGQTSAINFKGSYSLIRLITDLPITLSGYEKGSLVATQTPGDTFLPVLGDVVISHTEADYVKEHMGDFLSEPMVSFCNAEGTKVTEFDAFTKYFLYLKYQFDTQNCDFDPDQATVTVKDKKGQTMEMDVAKVTEGEKKYIVLVSKDQVAGPKEVIPKVELSIGNLEKEPYKSSMEVKAVGSNYQVNQIDWQFYDYANKEWVSAESEKITGNTKYKLKIRVEADENFVFSEAVTGSVIKIISKTETEPVAITSSNRISDRVLELEIIQCTEKTVYELFYSVEDGPLLRASEVEDDSIDFQRDNGKIVLNGYNGNAIRLESVSGAEWSDEKLNYTVCVMGDNIIHAKTCGIDADQVGLTFTGEGTLTIDCSDYLWYDVSSALSAASLVIDGPTIRLINIPFHMVTPAIGVFGYDTEKVLETELLMKSGKLEIVYGTKGDSSIAASSPSVFYFGIALNRNINNKEVRLEGGEISVDYSNVTGYQSFSVIGNCEKADLSQTKIEVSVPKDSSYVMTVPPLSFKETYVINYTNENCNYMIRPDEKGKLIAGLMDCSENVSSDVFRQETLRLPQISNEAIGVLTSAVGYLDLTEQERKCGDDIYCLGKNLVMFLVKAAENNQIGEYCVDDYARQYDLDMDGQYDFELRMDPESAEYTLKCLETCSVTGRMKIELKGLLEEAGKSGGKLIGESHVVGGKGLTLSKGTESGYKIVIFDFPEKTQEILNEKKKQDQAAAEADGKDSDQNKEALKKAISLKKAAISSVKNKKKKTLLVKWKKVENATGYQVQYSLKKKFKGKKAKTKTKETSKLKLKLKKLKKGKKYYVRVRAYTIVDGQKVYGDWSTVKKIKVKK